MVYRWDFSKIHYVSHRRGGRLAVIHKDGSTEWIDPDDQEEFNRQHLAHLNKNMDEFLKKFSSFPRRLRK